MNSAYSPLVLVSTESYQQCYNLTHLQVLVAVLLLEVLLFYTCHRSCMRPDDLDDDCELILVTDVTAHAIN